MPGTGEARVAVAIRRHLVWAIIFGVSYVPWLACVALSGVKNAPWFAAIPSAIFVAAAGASFHLRNADNRRVIADTLQFALALAAIVAVTAGVILLPILSFFHAARASWS